MSAYNWAITDINSFEWRIMNLFDSISRWSVPIFVMISGSLFLNRSITIKQIFGKYILRLIITFLVWSLVYAIVSYIVGSDKNIVTFISSFLKGHYHLWFIYMIIGLYMITPLLHKIVTDEKLIRYFLVLSFIFAILIPEIIGLVKEINSRYGDWAESVINQTHLQFVAGYTFYYILGYYISIKTISRKQSIMIYFGGIIGFASTMLFTLLISKYKGEATGIFYSNMTVNVALEALCIFVLFKNLFSNKAENIKKNNYVVSLSKYSYGSFLVHTLVIIVLDKMFGLTSLSFNTFVAIPVVSVSVFALSFIISAILNHIPFVKKYFV